jgi:hypothetical protein
MFSIAALLINIVVIISLHQYTPDPNILLLGIALATSNMLMVISADIIIITVIKKLRDENAPPVHLQI